MRSYLVALMAGIVVVAGGLQEALAAPAGGGGGGSKNDLTTNLQVVDSSSSPGVVGEVVSLDGYKNPIVALSPSLANAEPPLLVRVLGYNPNLNPSGVTLLGSDRMYYTDATCSTTPYFDFPTGVYTPSGVVVISAGATTSYQIYKPGSGPFIPQVAFNSFRDPTGPAAANGGVDFGACQLNAIQLNAIQAEPTPYSITLTPPFKLKNP